VKGAKGVKSGGFGVDKSLGRFFKIGLTNVIRAVYYIQTIFLAVILAIWVKTGQTGLRELRKTGLTSLLRGLGYSEIARTAVLMTIPSSR
jgi:hypothetical protein